MTFNLIRLRLEALKSPASEYDASTVVIPLEKSLRVIEQILKTTQCKEQSEK